MPRVSIYDSLPHNPEPPVQSSRERSWGEALTVDVHKGLRSFDLDTPAMDHHLVACMTAGVGRLEQHRNGKVHQSVMRAGDVLIVPAGQVARWCGATPEHLRMRIPAHHLDAAWATVGARPCRPAELQSIYQTREPFLMQLAALFATELRMANHPAQQMIVESATTIVASHLVRGYCTFGEKQVQRQAGLSAYVVNLITDYVEACLAETIHLQDLADVAGVTPFHFARVFKATTGTTPLRFVECARMRRAKILMQENPLKHIEEIGRCVGFRNASHFTRRFVAHYHQTPSEYLGRADESGCSMSDEEPGIVRPPNLHT